MTPVSCTEIATAFSKTPVEKPWQRKKLRTPQNDESLLVEPSISEIDNLLRQNNEIIKESSVSIAEESLAHLRKLCRQEILEAAASYTRNLDSESESPKITFPTSIPLIVTGHQPEMYHPGVWVKNFLAGKLAEKTGGLALNLIIDNDNLSTTTLRVPVGLRTSPSQEWIPFDNGHDQEPWEDARLNNPAMFSAFASKVTSLMEAWEISPIVAKMWQQCVSACGSFPLLRDVLTVGRHQLEREWGLDNLELPLSHLCETSIFQKFTAHILLNANQFQRIHNRILNEYRRINRIRSHTHPVPELKIVNRQIETPFWIWREGENDRKPLYVSIIDHAMILSDGDREFISVPCGDKSAIQNVVDAIKKLSQDGFRIRTRALTTTMFSRLFLADVFVHGIGGAKYDEMTDRLIVRFFGMTAPKFITASATLHLLAGSTPTVTQKDIRDTKRELSRLYYHPDLYLSHKTEEAEKLIREKLKLIDEQNGNTLRSIEKRHIENRARFLRLKKIRNELAGFSKETKEKLEHKLDKQQQKMETDRFLSDREFSFVLFPEDKLKRFMQNSARKSS